MWCCGCARGTMTVPGAASEFYFLPAVLMSRDALIPPCTLGHGHSLPEGLPQPSATDRDEEAGDAHDDTCTDTRSARPRRSL